jgi:glycosyltransferase EpsD
MLDEGPEKDAHLKLAAELAIERRVHFIGYTNQVTHYLAAADLMLHPSFSEASNSAVKEAGLLETAVAVCENVGDFSDYIEDGVNGFLMNKEKPLDDLKKVIKMVYEDRSSISKLGKELKAMVMDRFSLNETVLRQYEDLINVYTTDKPDKKT